MSTAERFIEAFWRKVRRGKADECWPWTGYKRASGHGLTSHDNAPMNASRKAWILTHGEIAPGLCVNHRCDNAACCNPAHMYLGTRADNMIDLWTKVNGDERCARGRGHVLTREQLVECYQMRKAGKTLKECAEHFDLHFATVCRLVTNYRRTLLNKRRGDKLSYLGRKVHTAI